MKAFFEKHRTAAYLFFFALALRLAFAPFVQNVEADAVSRVLLSEELLDHFRIIKSGHWPSLQFYFITLFLAIFRDRVIGPEILCILLGSVCIVPFYYFTRNIFNKKGALYASLLFTLSPVIFRNSFMPMSEIYFVCFSVFSMYYLSEILVNDDRKRRNALLCGLFITIAAGGRFEAWLLLAFFAAVLFLFKQWSALFYYLCTALIFPLFWMIGSYVDYHDMFYSLHSVDTWNLVREGHNEGLDKTEIIKRIVYFPISWAVMFGFGALVLGWYMLKGMVKRTLTKYQLAFLLIFLVMCGIFIVKSVNGSLFMNHRFTVTLVMLSAPFFALLFSSGRSETLKSAVAILLVVALIPFSFVWHKLPLDKLFFWQERMQHAVQMAVAESYKQSQALPLLYSPYTLQHLEVINGNLREGDGLLIDYIDWERSYFLAQGSHAPYDHVFVQEGAIHSLVAFDRISEMFLKYPQGIFVMRDGSYLTQATRFENGLWRFGSLKGGASLVPLYSSGGTSLFRYTYYPGK
jgi:4-amino-4-deoxy-L-arabinose transferase-like glycosyltransferase